ncbi:MAG: di-trans,poly-cis-decaprenylcistransferase [Pseudomonas fluorescens]|nr:MAG: di-trans,poly-cis-decaprenylcistransferase [Pseudomonas fluorescens]
MTTAAQPQHVAFIMDGNGRWAQKRGLARLKGHAEGIETVRHVCEELVKVGVPYATFYAFSTENWKRSWEEVSGLFTLMRSYFKSEMKALNEKNIRVRFIGDRSESSRLPADILTLMNDVEAETANNTALTATFAINYSGRDELLRATQKLAEEFAATGTHITAEVLETALDTHGIPDPDLVVRTSGEQRISNFLLWQVAYSEFYFANVAWPEFTATHLHEALSSFGNRERRFGAVPTASVA